MLKSIKVRDYMTRHLLTFQPDTDLLLAINQLLEHRVSAAPVVDEHGHLLGMLTSSHCLQQLLGGAYYEETGGTVGSCMDRITDSISPETDILKACDLLLQGDRQRLPVLEDGRLVGQISRHDLLRAVKEFAQHQPDRG